MSASWQQESAVNWSDFHKKWAEHSLTLGTPNFRHFKLWCTLGTFRSIINDTVNECPLFLGKSGRPLDIHGPHHIIGPVLEQDRDLDHIVRIMTTPWCKIMARPFALLQAVSDL